MVNAKWIPTDRSLYADCVHTEAHINHDLLTNSGVIKRAIVSAGLENLIFKYPRYIFFTGVVDFLTNLDLETLKMKILLQLTDEQGLTCRSITETLSFEELFKDIIPVPNVENDPESVGDPDIQNEFKRFTIDERAIFIRVKSKATCLRPPFNNLMNIAAKCLLGHSGSWSTITEQKLRLLLALCDAVDNDTPYNWRAWFIRQLVEAIKSIQK